VLNAISTPSTRDASVMDAPQEAASERVNITLPVHVCDSRYGIEPTSWPAAPASTSVSVPRDLADKVGLYTDRAQRLRPFLAPRGWDCRTLYAVDGATTFVAYPADDKHGRTWVEHEELFGPDPSQRRTTPPETAVVGYIVGACGSCSRGLACALDPRAAKSYLAYMGTQSCPYSISVGETTEWRRGSPTVEGATGDVILFSDPPRVHGTATPSGGDLTARGVLFYREPHGGSPYAGSAKETCVLPDSDRPLCEAIFEHFLLQRE
jgi:hypothetical protein